MGLRMKYFVLKPRSRFTRDLHARASREAMTAYANCIRKQDSQLAYDLIEWAKEESEREEKW